MTCPAAAGPPSATGRVCLGTHLPTSQAGHTRTGLGLSRSHCREHFRHYGPFAAKNHVLEVAEDPCSTPSLGQKSADFTLASGVSMVSCVHRTRMGVCYIEALLGLNVPALIRISFALSPPRAGSGLNTLVLWEVVAAMSKCVKACRYLGTGSSPLCTYPVNRRITLPALPSCKT